MFSLLAALSILSTADGEVRVEAPPDAEVYADGCAAVLDEGRLRGQPGCAVRVVVVHADGTVERQTVVLPSPDQTWALTAAVGFERDLAGFGFTGGAVGVGARRGVFGGRARWRRATGRAEVAALPDFETHVEETLDLYTVGPTLSYPLADWPARFTAAVDLGYGKLVAADVQTERSLIHGATQPLWVLAPAVGFELGDAWLRARVEWSATFARGEYFPADGYGTVDGTGPPERSGLLAHGPWLAVALIL